MCKDLILTRREMMLCIKFKNRFKSYFYLVVGFLFLISCAQVVPPSGGPKDITPPKALKYTPDSAQIQFNSKSILIEFDEYANLKDLNNQLVISPPLEYSPDINLKGKNLVIEFNKDEKLKPNTTYCINFGNSIQDFTENNAVKNFKYIFSTGNFIDSLSIKGKVKFAFNHKKAKDVLVLLYSDKEDTVVYKNKPDYFAKTNDDGFFQINNIKEGKYKLFALKDENNNYLYDNEAEIIGFLNDAIDVSIKDEIKIEMFQEAPKKIIIKKYAHTSYGKISLYFNQGSDSINMQILDNNLKGIQEFYRLSKTKDTLEYWIKNFDKDSLKLQVNNGYKIIDTLDIEMVNFEKAIKNNRSPLRMTLLSSPKGNFSFDLDIKNGIDFIFSNPIEDIKNEKILFFEDSVLIKNKFILNKTKDVLIAKGNLNDEKSNKIETLNENTKYKIIIPAGAITDIFGLKNDSVTINFTTRELKYYGTLKLDLKIPEIKGNYIVQLIDEKENIIRENSISKSEVIYYNYLHPLKYKIKIIKDENGNKKWDEGNFLKKEQPEKVIYNAELIQIRSNWDAEQVWDLKKAK